MTKEEYGRDENAAPAKDTTLSRVGDIVFSPVGTPRAGTLVCDGSAVSRQTYKELFDFLGVSCGEGDGETTFNLPDLRDVWILCAGTEHEAGDSVAEGLPNITGETIARIAEEDSVSGTGLGYPLFSPEMSEGAFAGTGIITQNQFSFALGIGDSSASSIDSPGNYLRFNASNANSIYGASQHVTPASVAVLPCIVYE